MTTKYCKYIKRFFPFFFCDFNIIYALTTDANIFSLCLLLQIFADELMRYNFDRLCVIIFFLFQLCSFKFNIIWFFILLVTELSK